MEACSIAKGFFNTNQTALVGIKEYSKIYYRKYIFESTEVPWHSTLQKCQKSVQCVRKYNDLPPSIFFNLLSKNLSLFC